MGYLMAALATRPRSSKAIKHTLLRKWQLRSIAKIMLPT